MTESDACRVLMLRAYEDPPAAPWSEADALWASQSATRALGEQADEETWLRQRALLALPRLRESEPRIERLLAASAWPGGLLGWLVPLAFLLGVAGENVGAGGRINILAPPLLALLVWNLAVYLLIGLAATGLLPSAGGLRAALTAGLRKLAGRALRGGVARRYADEWARATRPLTGARVAGLLHASAAALAAGALASLYLRGLAFEYRAGWDSTFLGAASVQQLLGAVLGPASALSGIRLPDAAELAQLRFSLGPGENAARWIHLYALTIAAVVLLPRLLLAGVAAWRARRLAAALPLPLEEPYFQRVLRARSGTPAQMQVLPIGYHLPASLKAGLERVLQRELGTPVRLALSPAIVPGDDDALAALLPALAGGAGTLLALLPLTATPERETHGALLQALRGAWPGTLRVLIDESAFRQRFDAADPARLAQRRQAWQQLLQEQGQAAMYADLSLPDRTAAPA